jgi:hypothetical protein
MPRLLTLSPITTAISTATTTPVKTVGAPGSMTIQANFTYGSAGSSVDCWVQTSLDNSNWIDVCNFHLDGSSQRYLFNLSAETPITSQYTPTDGSLSANTAVDGILGNRWRVKYSSSGTYAGGTSLTIDAIASNRMEAIT